MRQCEICPLVYLLAHWLDENFEKHNFILAASHFTDRHTGDHIIDQFDQICTDFGIQVKRRHLVVADGAANMRKAMRDIIFYAHCTIHNLQLCIEVSQVQTFII